MTRSPVTEQLAMPYLFSFGSNLHRAQLRSRCPSARLVGRASLPNHRLAFVGYSPLWKGAVATVIHRRGASVLGAVDELDDEDLVRLNRFEGFYVRVRRQVELPGGARLRAFLYRTTGTHERAPSLAYLSAIAAGYKALGYPSGALAAFALEAS